MPKLNLQSAEKFGFDNLRNVTAKNMADPVEDQDGVNKRTLTGQFLKYDDLPPMPMMLAKVGGTGIPTLTAFSGNIQQYTFAVNDYVYGATEVTHAYKEGTDIECHIHWASNGQEAVAKYVKWEFEYSVSNANGTFPASTVVTKELTISANTPTHTHKIGTITTIAGTGLKIGTYITWRLKRIAAEGTAPVANPFGIALGFHVLKDSSGSNSEYIK